MPIATMLFENNRKPEPSARNRDLTKKRGACEGAGAAAGHLMCARALGAVLDREIAELEQT